ncbi:hypothetical protein [Mycolicibacterium sp.]|uniref:hypothetical protein n=1 Tax=Mycolicibacterium sp. TaxID=2320850 RepID=UPI00355D0C63
MDATAVHGLLREHTDQSGQIHRDHEARIRALEVWKAQLVGRLTVVAAIGAWVGSLTATAAVALL